MSASALRAVRELRGEDSRPGTSSGARPGTSSGRLPSPQADAFHPVVNAAAAAATAKEIEDLKAALEKEKRNSRALEQYLSEVNEAKEVEIAAVQLEAKQAQQSLLKAEQHATSIEELYKAQVAKLTSTVERMQGVKTPKEIEESFSAVLREEMRTMQQAYTLKLDRAVGELQSKTTDFNRQIRALNEQLVEERRKNATLTEAKIAAVISPTHASSTSAATKMNGTAASSSSNVTTKPAASTASAAKSTGGLSSRGAPVSTAAAGSTAGKKPAAAK
jgi:predicted  nucleic acid-binding Zn-ribbon protein